MYAEKRVPSSKSKEESAAASSAAEKQIQDYLAKKEMERQQMAKSSK